MKASLLNQDILTEFRARGGKVTRVGVDETTGITCREWKRLVRADTTEVVEDIAPAPRNLHLHVGHGTR